MKSILSSIIFLLCAALSFAQMTIELSSYPQLTPLLDDIYIAGSFNDWNPADPNYKLQVQISGNLGVVINGVQGSDIEFKFTRGSSDWSDVEGNTQGQYIGNRTSTIQNGSTSALFIEGWEDLPGMHTVTPNVFILSDEFYIPQLNRYRRIWIALPEGYSLTTQYFPVLYMHDAQNIFDQATSFAGEWQIDESIVSNTLQDCSKWIVVGIDNGGVDRIDEYAPWVNTEYSAGGYGEEFTNFIVETLKPYIDSHFRTLGDREFTAVGGSSLGSLLATYMVLQHPDVFSKAALFSPAYWFNHDELLALAQTAFLPNDTKFYFVGGTNEGSNMITYINEMKNTLIEAGLGAVNAMVFEDPNGQHNEQSWAGQFPACYQWLMGCANGIEEKEESIELEIFPNPSSDSVMIRLNDANEKIGMLRILDSQGKILLERKSLSHSKEEINSASLSQGRYIVMVQSTNGKEYLRHLIKIE